MLTWLQANLGTVIVAAVLALVLGLLAFKLLRDKKNGKSSCSCGCTSCALKGKCRKES